MLAIEAEPERKGCFSYKGSEKRTPFCSFAVDRPGLYCAMFERHRHHHSVLKILIILIQTKRVAPFPLAPALKGGGKKNSSISHQNLRFASFWKEADKTEIFCTSFRLFRQSFCFIRLTSEWFKKKPNNNLSQQHTSYISLTTNNLQLTTYNLPNPREG